MIKHIMNYAPSKIIPGVVNFLGLMIYARIFTKEEYGRYAYVMAIIGLVQSVFYPWIRMSLVRYYQKYKKEGNGNKYLHYTLYLFFVVSLFLTLVWGIFILLFDAETPIRLLLFLGLPLMVFNSLFDQLMGLSRAKLDSRNFAINNVLQSIFRLGMVLILVYLFHLNEVAIFLSLILTNFILVIIYFKKKIDINYQLLKSNKNFRKEIVSYGIPLTFTFLLVFIINMSDRILIKYFLNNEAVGLYSIPYEFSTFTITNIFMVLNLPFFPVIIKEYEHLSFKKVINRIKQYFNILTFVVFPTTVSIFALAPYITELILGENYNTESAISIVRFTSLAGFFAGMKAYYFDMAFHLGNKTNIQIIPVAISGISNVAFNIYLIPLYGVLGAVYATIIAFVLGIIFSYLLGKRIIAIPVPFKSLIKVMLPTVILFFILTFSPFNVISWWNFVLNIFMGVFSYLVLAIVFDTADVRTFLINTISNNHINKDN